MFAKVGVEMVDVLIFNPFLMMILLTANPVLFRFALLPSRRSCSLDGVLILRSIITVIQPDDGSAGGGAL